MGPAMPGETPWRAAILWAERRGLSHDEADFLTDMLRVLDGEFLAAKVREAKKA